MPLPNWVNWGILFDQFFTSKVQPKPIRRATVLHLQAMELVTSFHLQDGIGELGGRDVCYVYIYFCILTCYNDFPDFRWVGYSRHPIPILSISVTFSTTTVPIHFVLKQSCMELLLLFTISRCAGLVVRDGCCTPGTAEFRVGCLFKV